MNVTIVHDLAVAQEAAAYGAAAKALTDAATRLQSAVHAFREAHPAPPGMVWRYHLGAMRLDPVDDRCGYLYTDGSTCGDDTPVRWDADGTGYCARHA